MSAIAIVQAAAEPGDAAAKALLVPFIGGTGTASVLYYEGFGRSPSELTTLAVSDADGGWTINGDKRAVVHPAASDLTVVLAQVNGKLAAFALDRTTSAAITVIRDDNAVGKLGVRSAHTGDVRLAELHVPGSALLGPPGSVALHRALAWYRLTTASVAIGVGVAAVEYATRYAKERVAFGQQIIDYQGVEFPLVDSDMALDAVRLNVQGTWEEVQELTDTDEIARLTSAASGATLVAVNTLGGHGYLADHPVERWYRDATTLSAVDFDPIMHSGALV
jgi:hypothetical protein